MKKTLGFITVAALFVVSSLALAESKLGEL